MNLLDAIRDPKLFERWFRPLESWKNWLVFLAALFALKLSDVERSVPDALARYRARTNRDRWPDDPFGEAWLVIGRRGGKSLISALVAVWLACFRDYSSVLKPGERGVVMVLAADRKQAQVVFRYIRALLRVPMLAKMVGRETQEEIEIGDQVLIGVHTSSYRSVRGRTLIAAICDEVAFWADGRHGEPGRGSAQRAPPGHGLDPGCGAHRTVESLRAARRSLDAYRRQLGEGRLGRSRLEGDDTGHEPDGSAARG